MKKDGIDILKHAAITGIVVLLIFSAFLVFVVGGNIETSVGVSSGIALAVFFTAIIAGGKFT